VRRASATALAADGIQKVDDSGARRPGLIRGLDFHELEGAIALQHFAFLIDEDTFDDVFGRIRARGLQYWADPGRTKAGELYQHNGGRGAYFQDPDGHLLEIMTRRYGSGEPG